MEWKWKILTKDGHNQGLFLKTQTIFFDFQIKAGEASPTPPLVAHLWVWLNM